MHSLCPPGYFKLDRVVFSLGLSEIYQISRDRIRYVTFCCRVFLNKVLCVLPMIGILVLYSNLGLCITELVDGLVNVIHAEEYQRPDFNKMIDITVSLSV